MHIAHWLSTLNGNTYNQVIISAGSELDHTKPLRMDLAQGLCRKGRGCLSGWTDGPVTINLAKTRWAGSDDQVPYQSSPITLLA